MRRHLTRCNSYTEWVFKSTKVKIFSLPRLEITWPWVYSSLDKNVVRWEVAPSARLSVKNVSWSNIVPYWVMKWWRFTGGWASASVVYLGKWKEGVLLVCGNILVWWSTLVERLSVIDVVVCEWGRVGSHAKVFWIYIGFSSRWHQTQ